ncbi:hypothetical protein Drorol1_Dr00002626 [Drosera rotundifolia]
MKVHIETKETLKPSTATLPHLKYHKLSFFEQFVPPYYTPVILFYNIDDGHGKLHLLKQALSRTLTKFPPLAGRFHKNMCINCNDEGILYVEARVDGAMMDFLKDIDIMLLEKFLPCKKAYKEKMSEVVQAAVQVNVFECGGIAIGACFSHKIMDASSIDCFLRYWAANFDTSDHVEEPILLDFTTASSLFPPRDEVQYADESYVEQIEEDICSVKRFVFNASAIKSLKEKAASDSLPNPSRVEVISAFVWKQAHIALDKVNNTSGKGKGHKSYLTHVINLRKSSLSPLSKGCIGCLTLPSAASCNGDEREKEIGWYVDRVHKSIQKINKEHLNRFRGEEGLALIWEGAEMFLYGRDGLYSCSSWCKLGVNDVDFGWGKPVWISPWSESPSPGERNFLTLMDINGDEAVEAWLVLEKQEMAILESDQEFLTYATPVTGIYTGASPDSLSSS